MDILIMALQKCKVEHYGHISEKPHIVIIIEECVLLEIELGNANEVSPGCLDQMYRMRARAFYRRRGWSVLVQNGRERDNFDNCNTDYLLVRAGSALLGSLRILPSTGPTMIADVFHEILVDAPMPRSSDVAEVSRLCIDPDRIRQIKSGLTPNRVTRVMLSALFARMAKRNVKVLIGVHDLMVERILRQCGWPPQRLGKAVKTDTGLITVASCFHVPPVPPYQGALYQRQS